MITNHLNSPSFKKLMSLSNLSSSVLLSIIDSADINDCRLLISKLKERLNTLESKSYILFCIYVNEYLSSGNPIHIRHFHCKSEYLYNEVWNSLKNWLNDYEMECCPYQQFLFNMSKEELINEVNGSTTNELLVNCAFKNELDAKLFYEEYGLQLFSEIDKSVGLLKFFDAFPFFHEDKVIGLIRNTKNVANFIKYIEEFKEENSNK